MTFRSAHDSAFHRIPNAHTRGFMRLAGSFSRHLLVLALGLVATQTTRAAAPPIPPPPAVEARSYLLEDFNSGRIIVDHGMDDRIEPASLTKLMTAYIVYSEIKDGRIKLTDKVTVSKKAWRTGGSKMFIEVNSRVSVENLLKGMIIQSGNDASIALAEYAAGSEDAFASLMNQYAERLGMEQTHFVNATGLPNPEHYTTAHDLGILARVLIHDYPDHYTWYSQHKFRYNGIEQYNRNKLLWRDPSVDGLKTGHTESAGYCLVASAKQGDMRLISVVLGTKSEDARANESRKLLNYGFRFYETHKLYTAGQTVTSPQIWKGDVKAIPLGLRSDLYVTIPHQQYPNLKASMNISTPIIAPVRKNENLGNMKVTLDGETVAERPLYAIRNVGEGSLSSRLIDEVKLMFK